MSYNPEAAVAYAHEWAFKRNPRYYNFDGIGGDCTNFISQCLYAGCKVMNYTKDTGWYYTSATNRSAAWSGVPYLYNFLTANKSRGPYGHEAPLEEASVGDIIQLRFDGMVFSHSLFVVSVGASPNHSNIRITTHTIDSDNRPLNTYLYVEHRLIKIDGVRN